MTISIIADVWQKMNSVLAMKVFQKIVLMKWSGPLLRYKLQEHIKIKLCFQNGLLKYQKILRLVG